MKLSVEISKYPLSEQDYVAAIKDFLARINQHQYQNIQIHTNVMSTQLFGGYDEIMTCLQTEMKATFEKYGTSVFVCKFIPDNLLEKYAD